MRSVKTNRNGLVEVLRFIASLAIAVYHFEWLCIGAPKYFNHLYIFVELFFVISGFFLVFNIEKSEKNTQEKSDGITYVVKQIKKLYPMYFLAFLIIFIIKNVNVSSMTQLIQNFWSAKWEILLLQSIIIGQGTTFNLGGAPEFISALLFSSFLLHYIVKNHRESFITFIGPAIITCGLGFIITKYGNLSQWGTFNIVVSSGVIRALVDMSVGAWFALVVYPKVSKLSNTKKTFHLGLIILSLLALVILKNHISYADLIIYIFIFAYMICLLNSIRNSNTFNSFLVFLGEMSYPIFLFHYPVLYLMEQKQLNINYLPKLLLSVLLILFCSFVFWGLERLVKYIRKAN